MKSELYYKIGYYLIKLMVYENFIYATLNRNPEDSYNEHPPMQHGIH